MVRETISVAPWCRSAWVMSEEMSSGWSCISPCMFVLPKLGPGFCPVLSTLYQLPHHRRQGQPLPSVIVRSGVNSCRCQDRRSRQGRATRGGAWGETLQGPVPPILSDEIVDAAVAEPLRAWLTWGERRELAEARDGADVPTTAGIAMPVGDR